MLSPLPNFIRGKKKKKSWSVSNAWESEEFRKRFHQIQQYFSLKRSIYLSSIFFSLKALCTNSSCKYIIRVQTHDYNLDSSIKSIERDSINHLLPKLKFTNWLDQRSKPEYVWVGIPIIIIILLKNSENKLWAQQNYNSKKKWLGHCLKSKLH